MIQTSPLDALEELANDYSSLLAEKARQVVEEDAVIEDKKRQKEELWPVCLASLREAVESINARLTRTGAMLKVTTNNSETLTKRDDWQDRVEVLFLGQLFVNDNWLVEVDKLGHVSVCAIKRDRGIFLLATSVAQLNVAEGGREKWEEIFVPLVSKRIQKLMTY